MATRIQTETVLVHRVGPLLAAADMAVTVVGANADLNDPIAWGVRQAGGATADPSTATSAEIGAIADADLDELFDLAEYRTLQNIQGNLDDVDIKVGPRSEKLSQLSAQIEKKLARLETRIGDMLTPLETGYITQNFVETG